MRKDHDSWSFSFMKMILQKTVEKRDRILYDRENLSAVALSETKEEIDLCKSEL